MIIDDRSANAFELPIHVSDIFGGSVPEKLHALYEDAPHGGYKLTPAAKILAGVRAAMRESPAPVKLPEYGPAKPPQISRADWTNVMAAAAPEERKVLLQRVAAGHVRVV